jgi:putative transposase
VGFDDYAGKDYSHRKHWVLERLSLLSSIFTIEVCAYAVMSNRYHLVLFVDQARGEALTQREIIERWTRVYGTPPVIAGYRYLSGEFAGRGERGCRANRLAMASSTVRHELVHEVLERTPGATCERGGQPVRGKFWESRFRSQALLDEAGYSPL